MALLMELSQDRRPLVAKVLQRAQQQWRTDFEQLQHGPPPKGHLPGAHTEAQPEHSMDAYGAFVNRTLLFNLAEWVICFQDAFLGNGQGAPARMPQRSDEPQCSNRQRVWLLTLPPRSLLPLSAASKPAGDAAASSTSSQLHKDALAGKAQPSSANPAEADPNTGGQDPSALREQLARFLHELVVEDLLRDIETR